MVLILWIAFRFTPGGHLSFTMLINSFMHILMYTHLIIRAIAKNNYLITYSAKCLIALHVVELTAIFLHTGQLIFRDCQTGYPSWYTWVGMCCITLLGVLEAVFGQLRVIFPNTGKFKSRIREGEKSSALYFQVTQ